MYLNASTDKIEIVLGGTVATNQLQWNVSYQDITSSGMTLPQSGGAGLTNNATAVDIVAAPASSTTRQVTQINVYNADTATATVTIRKDVSGTKYVLCRIVLATTDTLNWSREYGWTTVKGQSGIVASTGLTNSSGNLSVNLSTGIAGGQSVIGGINASNSLTLSSTTNATKGNIFFGTSVYDEVNNRLGIGVNTSLSYPVTIFDTTNAFLNFNINTGSNRFGGHRFQVNGFDRYTIAYRGQEGNMIFSRFNSTGVYQGDNLTFFNSSGNIAITGTGSATDGGFRLDVSGTTRLQGALSVTTGGASITGNLTISDTSNIILATGTGTKIGTGNTQKLGFWNATPIAQPTTAVATAVRVGGGGITLTETDTFDGYTLAQVVKALRNAGLLA